MTITLRSAKGSALTHAELDGNFSDLVLATGPGFFHIEEFGGAADGVTENAAIANTALAALDALGGGTLIFGNAGTYLLEETGAYSGYASHRQCILIPGDNIHIYLPNAGTILKLKDGEQTDGNGAVEIISFSNERSNISIVGHGATITGNTAGQTGWTGGYAQNDNGNIISSQGGASSGTDILIQGVNLEDHFSSPINLGLNRTGRGKRVNINDCVSKNCGEGFQVIAVDGMEWHKIKYLQDAVYTMAGDVFELSGVKDFLISHLVCDISAGTPSGAALDLFGSQNGLVTDFLIIGANVAVSAASTGGDDVDDVVVCNGIIKDCVGADILERAQGRLVYRDIEVYDCAGTCFQVSDDAAFPFELYNVKFDGCANALVSGARKLIWHGGGNSNSTSQGIVITSTGTATRNLDLCGLNFTGCASFALFFNGSTGEAEVQSTVGRVVNCISDTPLSSKLGASTSKDDLSGLMISGVTPSLSADNASPPSRLPFVKTVQKASGNLGTLGDGSSEQELLIEATGSFTVFDASDGSGDDVHLNGAANFVMTAGDRLMLRYNGSGWYELYRSVNT